MWKTETSRGLFRTEKVLRDIHMICFDLTKTSKNFFNFKIRTLTCVDPLQLKITPHKAFKKYSGFRNSFHINIINDINKIPRQSNKNVCAQFKNLRQTYAEKLWTNNIRSRSEVGRLEV